MFVTSILVHYAGFLLDPTIKVVVNDNEVFFKHRGDWAYHFRTGVRHSTPTKDVSKDSRIKFMYLPFESFNEMDHDDPQKRWLQDRVILN